MRDGEGFSFGRNWKHFLKRCLTPERIEIATAQTREALGLDTLRGLTFLDIGCGSGLFSYAAHSLNAERVTSFDIDPDSVRCCLEMRARAGNPENWTVFDGSILDTELLQQLPQADIVYSWGVLHHTGDMWQAIRNAAKLVKPGGRFLIAIYNNLEYDTLTGLRGSRGWLKLKRFYNNSGGLIRRCMECTMASKDILKFLITLNNPFTAIRRYEEQRGMSWWHDIVDWLGGYPYEFASVSEVFNFCHREFGMELQWLQTNSSIGCNEFVFENPANDEDADQSATLGAEESAPPKSTDDDWDELTSSHGHTTRAQAS